MTSTFDIVCLSHLRWDFVYQRPQHLLNRAARDHRVIFFEEPIHGSGRPYLEARRQGGVLVATPHLPAGTPREEAEEMQRELLDQLLADEGMDRWVLWYYTPMALGFSSHLEPLATVYDCMDELSAFAMAPPLLREREKELFRRADLVFTGGQSLYEAKRSQHPRVYAFPSSVDTAHFRTARDWAEEPPDQAGISRPRMGYFGVIDERIDLKLLADLAEGRPDWQLVMIGPVAKIDPERLPKRDNIHYLGKKDYAELPAYLAGWDAALMPFACNEATRFISPTKTPEYLAAGRPVVSTPIPDVVRPYGEMGLVKIAEGGCGFARAIEEAMAGKGNGWQKEVDGFLMKTSWDKTWGRMLALIENQVSAAHQVS